MDGGNIDDLILWLRRYFAICAGVYLGTAMIGSWWATHSRTQQIWPLLVIVFAAYFVTIPFHWSFTNDDSYIFYRYAENLSAGKGYTYNDGVACEGFTSPAWLWLLSAASVTGVDVESASKALGVALGAVALLLIVLTLRSLTDHKPVLFLTAFFVATCQLLLAWIPSGMDAALFICWLAAWTYVLTAKSTQSWPLLLMTAFGVWIRPEANLIIAVGWGWWFWNRRAALSTSRSLPLLLAILACLALPLLWRYTTFGDLLPTTYYAKTDRTIRSGIGFLFGAIHGYGPIIWCVSLIGLWGLRRTMGWAAASVLALGAYVVWVGGDVLIQRFSLWWLPFVALGLAAVLKELGWSRSLSTSGVIAALLAVLLVGQELHRMYSVTRFMSENDGYVYVSANAIHTLEADAAIGHYLREHGSPVDTVMTDNIGAIGYYSRMSILDVNGLVDREIAELIHRNNKTQLPTLIEARRPTWIVCYPERDSTRESFNLPNVGELPRSVVASYNRIGTWKSRTGYTRVLLRRRDG